MNILHEACRAGCAVVALTLCLAAVPAQAMSLSQAYQLALKHDPSIAVIEAQYAAEQQLGDQIVGSLKPNIALQGNYSYDHLRTGGSPFSRLSTTGGAGSQTYKYGSFGAGITLSQPLYRFDWSARKQQAKALDASADAAYVDRRQALLLSVAQNYFSVLSAQQDLALATAEAKSIRESLEDTKKRYSVGVVPGIDLKEAQARDDLAQARLISAREALNTARDLLQQSTGADGTTPLSKLTKNTRLQALKLENLDSLIAKARQHNLALQVARESVKVATAQLSTAKAALWPTVDAVASFNHNDNSDYDFGQRTDDARIGVQLSVPLYAGGINRSKVAQAQAELAVAKADLARQQSNLLRSIRQNFHQLQAAYAQANAFRIAVESARAARSATDNGYHAGTRTITDVLNARSAVVQAERNLSNSRYSLLLEWLRLQRQCGSLNAKALQRVDALLQPAVNSSSSKPSAEQQKG